jgi:hypothetical protein
VLFLSMAGSSFDLVSFSFQVPICGLAPQATHLPVRLIARELQVGR